MDHKLHQITKKHRLVLKKADGLYGGDINRAYILQCEEGHFVIKMNDAARYPNMFETEAAGLELLSKSGSFRIPEVHGVGVEASEAYILMEYLEPGTASSKFWEQFALKLAALHKNSRDKYGLDHNNYIGKLTQYNHPENNQVDFYINQRLEPQLKMAGDNGFHFNNIDRFYKIISGIIPEEKPALVHGDLWNGNYLVAVKGAPALIDPAVAYAHRETDLAMMKLFGGFPDAVFNIYNEMFHLEYKWKERIPVWQLYYLLVHLNLFGRGYFHQVDSILRMFS